MKQLFATLLFLVLALPEKVRAQTVRFAQQPINIDGKGNEADWQKSPWIVLKYLWDGRPAKPTDFKGRLKYLADEDHIYVLAEIEDDTLIDIHKDPLDFYWDDDCLEIFIDSDASGGIHQYNHSAFAYHISLAGEALDMGEDHKPLILDHIKQKRVCNGKKCVWEVQFQVYGNDYTPDGLTKKKVLKPGDKVRLAGAYCDNDYSKVREHFYGTMIIPGKSKNRAWIDASLFPIYTIK